MTAATPPYRWCSLYVDTPDRATVVADLARMLGAPSELDVFAVPGFAVDVRGNPDRTESDHFLDWRTMVEVDSDAGIPDREVVDFVTALIGRLRAAGHRVAAECDFAGQLPPNDTR